MIPAKHSFSLKLLLTLLSVSLVLSIIHLLLQYVNLELLNEQFGPFFELTNRFDFDDEVSVPTWISQLYYLIFGALCFVSYKFTVAKKTKRLWLLLAVLAFIGSVDEGAGLHELVLQSVHNVYFVNQAPSLLANAWWIVLPMIVLVAAYILILVKQRSDKLTLVLFSAAAVIFMTGAVLVDLITTSSPGMFIAQGIFVAIEEFFELLGLSIANLDRDWETCSNEVN